jgi:hypothetical protein
MIGVRLLRTSGTLLVLGGMVLAVMEVVTAVAYPGDTAAQAREALWTPAFLLIVVSTMLLLLGTPVLYSRIAETGGWMAQAGLIMIAVVGMGLGVFGNFMQALIVPWIASNDPSMLSASAPAPAALSGFFIVSGVIEVLGLAALAVPLLRGRLRPRWAGGVLGLAAVLGVLSFVTTGSSMSSNPWLSLLSAAPAVLFAIFFVEMGRQMLTGPAVASRAVPGESVAAMPQY